MMGSDKGDPEERPRHAVVVRSFELAKTLATNAQYDACVADGACTPSHLGDGTCFIWDGARWGSGPVPKEFFGPDHPVVCVDWEQARAFAKWAGGRLPTEAEWEYAARSAGKDRLYPWGDEPPTCELSVISEGGADGCGRRATWPVCSKPKGDTEQGLCDMAGDAWQWTEDVYGPYAGAPADGVRATHRSGYDPRALRLLRRAGGALRRLRLWRWERSPVIMNCPPTCMDSLDFPFDESKAIQAAAILVRDAGGFFDYYLMQKCLYAVEHDALSRWGQPVIGGDLKMLKWGPVNQSAMDALREEREGMFSECFERNGNEIRLKKDPGTAKLSRAEIALIKRIFHEWKDLNFREAHDKSMAFPECEDVAPVNWIPADKVLRRAGRTEAEIEEIGHALKVHRLLFESKAQ